MKYNRQSEIIALINENEIEKPRMQLSERLREKGYMVTQATISRDIRELGLIKVTGSTGKYQVRAPAPRAGADRLEVPQSADRDGDRT